MYNFLRQNSPIIDSLSNALIAIISILGLILILTQLSQIKTQNSLLESSLRQAYRPLAVACTNPESPASGEMSFINSKENPDKFSMQKSYSLLNNGQGFFSYIGQFNYVSDKLINFRKLFLSSKIDSLHVDGLSTEARRTAIFPTEKSNIVSIKTNVVWQDLPFLKKYYIYVLFLYEDQAGNLYDTDHLESIPFQAPQITGSFMTAPVDTSIGIFAKESFHYYTPQEREKLISVIQSLRYPKNHPIAQILKNAE